MSFLTGGVSHACHGSCSRMNRPAILLCDRRLSAMRSRRLVCPWLLFVGPVKVYSLVILLLLSRRLRYVLESNSTLDWFTGVHSAVFPVHERPNI